MASIPDAASTSANGPVGSHTLVDTFSASLCREIVPANSKSFDKRFPPSIQLAIFERIENAVTSTCLSLTSQSLYEIHWARHGKAYLHKFVTYGPKQEHHINLGLLLKNWMSSHLAYDFKAAEFIKCITLASRFIEWEDEEERILTEIDDLSEQLEESISCEIELDQHLEEVENKLFIAEEELEEAMERYEVRRKPGNSTRTFGRGY